MTSRAEDTVNGKMKKNVGKGLHKAKSSPEKDIIEMNQVQQTETKSMATQTTSDIERRVHELEARLEVHESYPDGLGYAESWRGGRACTNCVIYRWTCEMKTPKKCSRFIFLWILVFKNILLKVQAAGLLFSNLPTGALQQDSQEPLQIPGWHQGLHT